MKALRWLCLVLASVCVGMLGVCLFYGMWMNAATFATNAVCFGVNWVSLR